MAGKALSAWILARTAAKESGDRKLKRLLTTKTAQRRSSNLASRAVTVVVVLEPLDHKTNRADDPVEHPQDLTQRLPQEQRPDHIYGLRQTRNFENLLLARLPSGEYVGDKLSRQPHADLGEPMLFPFLVVEAKAGNAADDWLSICLQTAFPIYTYLNTQQSLRLATGHRSRWTSGPLVWFFVSRGEDWRLYLAYQSPLEPGSSSQFAAHTTNIAQAWAGCITNRDDAIQLFLIVDYVADWARDIYRPAALDELRILAPPDVEIATTFTDTDIFSTRDIALNHSSGVSFNAADDANAAFRSLDTEHGAVRHVSPIESRFLSIIITADNVQTFLLSMNQRVRKFFVRKLLGLLHIHTRKPHVLGIDSINAIEEKWSSNKRLGMTFHLKDTKFFTVHQVTYYLSPYWSQVRDLCLISVAEDALDALITASELKAGKGKAKKPGCSTCSDMVDRVSLLKNASSRHNLLACITRCAGYMDTSVELSPDRALFIPSEPLIWELINSTYKFLKKGDLEPELPFLRVSGCLDTQSGLFTDDTGSLPVYSDLTVSKEGAVLITGGDLRNRQCSPAKLCVYLTESSAAQPPQPADLARIIKTTFENCDVYHTTRDNGTLNLKTEKEYRDIWNLKDPYGFFFSYGGPSFFKWLKAMDSPVPTRQGSPRGPTDTGQILFSREYSPWHDPRHIYGGPWADLKKKFLKRFFEAEATAWIEIARQRKIQGINCCDFCAEDQGWDYEWEGQDYDSLYDASDAESADDHSPNLCEECKANLDLFGSAAFPVWVIELLSRALREGYEAPTGNGSANPSEDYTRSTPPGVDLTAEYYIRGAEKLFALPSGNASASGSASRDSNPPAVDSRSDHTDRPQEGELYDSDTRARKRKRADDDG
ncbi:hypothetical protein BDV10DRAFT_182743 [Aspergillus recurvatus]